MFIICINIDYFIIYKYKNIKINIGENNQIWRVPDYGHTRYLRNHKLYKKNVNESNIIII